jgi:hypothetical protein
MGSMGRAWRAVALAATVGAAACGGGSSGPSAATAPSSSGDASKVAQLDASNFDSLALSAARPAVVEFHSPT